MVTGKPIEITDEDFDNALRENAFVIVDFWADWCRPCHALAPVLKDLAEKYAGQVVFAKIDTEANPRKMTEYGVMGLPTLLFFKKGALVDTVVGAMPKAMLDQRIQKHL
jgi:thioredoxin 1